MDYDSDEQSSGKHEARPEHYYGDYVRRLFLAAGALMVLSYPFFKSLVSLPIWGTLLLALMIGMFAGLQSPRNHWSVFANVGLAAIAFLVFAYRSASFYASEGYAQRPIFFWTNQLLALIFFFALYFGVKSTRAKM